MTKKTPAAAASNSKSGLFEGLSGFRLGPALVVILLVWAFFASQSPVFLSPGNLSNLTLQITVTATIALGLVFVLLLGEIDLSGAALSGVAAGLAGMLATQMGVNTWLAVVVALAFGIVWSVVQATIILYGAPSFVVTLAGSLTLGGLLLVVLPDAGQISLANSPISLLASTYLPGIAGWVAAVSVIALAFVGLYSRHRKRSRLSLKTALLPRVILPTLIAAVLVTLSVAVLNGHRGVPIMFGALVLIIGVLSYIMKNTTFGVRIYATGGNREAARRAGIPVQRVILWSFVIAGLFAALGGILAASRLLGVSNQSGGGTLLLEAIAAAIIGGTSLFGGKGSVWSALLGALLIGSVSNGMDLLGLPTEAKLMTTGFILVAAIVSDVVLSRGSTSWPRQ